MKLKFAVFILLPLIGFSQQNRKSETDSLKTSNIFILGEVVITQNQKRDTLNRITSKKWNLKTKWRFQKH